MTSSTVAVTRAPSTDNVGVAGSRRLSWNQPNLDDHWDVDHLRISCGTAYTFGIDSFDAAGNRSARVD